MRRRSLQFLSVAAVAALLALGAACNKGANGSDQGSNTGMQSTPGANTGAQATPGANGQSGNTSSDSMGAPGTTGSRTDTTRSTTRSPGE